MTIPRTEKYSVTVLGLPHCISLSRISIAIMGLFSTRLGNLAGVRPRPEI